MPIKFVANIDQKRGKCLLASAEIYPHEIIYREQPLVCQYEIDNDTFDNDYVCRFCLTPLETAEENASRLTNEQIQLPFIDNCLTDKTKHVSCSCNEKYCSIECRCQAYQHYHQILCPMEEWNLKKDIKIKMEKLIEFWKENQNHHRASFILLLLKIICRIKQDNEFSKKLKQLSVNIQENYVENFLNKIFGDNVEEKIDRLRLLIKEIIDIDASTEYFFTNTGLKSLISLMQKYTKKIFTSAFDRWADNCQRLECEDTNDLIEDIYKRMEKYSGPKAQRNNGIGLFQMLESIQHSCDPKAKLCFPENNSTLAIKSIRSISIGEEINVFLFDKSLQYRSRHSRRKNFKNNFYDCNCCKCERQMNDPDCTSDENKSDSDLNY